MWSLSKPTAHVALSAQRVVVAQVKGLWPGSAVNVERMECVPNDDAPLWRPPVDALVKWLSAQERKPALHIVLSARFIRWQLLDERLELSHPKELAAYAALRFKETYGRLAEDWHLLLSLQGPGRTVPACGVDAALLETLRSATNEAGVSLISVAPYLSVAFDRWSRSLKGTTLWFGVLEADCISLALLRNGSFAGLRAQRLDGPLREVLPSLLAQMGIACGVSDATLPIYLVGDAQEPPALPVGLAVQWLRTKPHQTPSQLGIRMALGV